VTGVMFLKQLSHIFMNVVIYLLHLIVINVSKVSSFRELVIMIENDCAPN
jgi:hypothetical protein